MLEAIVFDFDGVVADTEPLHYRAFQRVLEPMDMGFDYATYMRDYIGCDDRDAFRLAYRSADHALPDERLVELIHAKSQAFHAVVAQGVDVFAGVVELIESAADRMPIAICSGALRSDIDGIMPAVGDGALLERFKAIVTAEDVARSKPDPSSYLLAAERLGIAPPRCLAIEDTPAGLASARGAGMKTLGVATTHPPSDLSADRVVSSLSQVNVDGLREWWASNFQGD